MTWQFPSWYRGVGGRIGMLGYTTKLPRPMCITALKNKLSDLYRTELAPALAGLAYALVDVARHNARQLLLGGATMVALATGAAFAVVTIAPSEVLLPAQMVTESVAPLALSLVSPVADADAFVLYRTTTTKPTDTVDGLLTRLGVSDSSAAQFIRQDEATLRALLAPYHRVKVHTNAQRQLTQLNVVWPSEKGDFFHRLRVLPHNQGWQSVITTEPLVAVNRFASAQIRSSLFAAIDDAGIPDAVGIQVAEIFSGQIDFHRDLRKGDQFTVVYQALLADGEIMRTGKVLASDFVNNGQTLRALWFEQGGGPDMAGAYFTPDGKSLKKEFLASPLAFSRITSGFAMRLHPIAKVWKAHLGVDYGAPTGTPVRTIGAGRVSFAGVQNGFGNVVHIDHGKNQSTVYAHLSKIAVRQGQVVQQGQTVGAVGATGWATGPHLHFEFRVAGQHMDPVTVIRKSQSLPLAAAHKPLFEAQAKDLGLQLQMAATMTVASAQ